MASNALFLAPRETSDQVPEGVKIPILTPIPDTLRDLGENEAEPAYKNIFIVRIDNANPVSLRVTVSDVPIGSLTLQDHLNQSHLDKAGDPAYLLKGANTGRNLNLKFKTKYDGGALIVFLMADRNATFVNAEIQNVSTHGIVRAKDGTDDVIFRARSIGSTGQTHNALSVILKPLPKNVIKREQTYGLIVRLVTDDCPSGSIDIVIDPKVENEGQG
jgi:hypothetical protein